MISCSRREIAPIHYHPYKRVGLQAMALDARQGMISTLLSFPAAHRACACFISICASAGLSRTRVTHACQCAMRQKLGSVVAVQLCESRWELQGWHGAAAKLGTSEGASHVTRTNFETRPACEALMKAFLISMLQLPGKNEEIDERREDPVVPRAVLCVPHLDCNDASPPRLNAARSERAHTAKPSRVTVRCANRRAMKP